MATFAPQKVKPTSSLILIENELRYYLIEWSGQGREEQEAGVNAVIEQIKILEVPSQN